MPVVKGGNGGGGRGKKSVKIKSVAPGPGVSSPPPPPPPPPPSQGAEEEEEEEYEGEGEDGEWGEMMMEGEEDEMTEVVEEEAEEDAGPQEPVFMCHEINPDSAMRAQFSMIATGSRNTGVGSVDGDALYLPSKYGIKYRMLDPDDLQYRPAALAEVNQKIAQFNGKRSNIVGRLIVQVNAQLSQYGCHRRVDKENKVVVPLTTMGDERLPKEGMDKLMSRLKIYKRVLSTLVIYFRAYAPLLFNIKKSYDDMLGFRIRQFKAAQHEKIRIYHDVTLVYAKMKEYQFPEYEKLLKGQQYLNLLMVRIQKQDEAIQCLTEILRKMERALAEHYEQERDLQEQIRLLDHEREERMEKAAASVKKFEGPPEEDAKDKKAGAELTEGLENGEAEEEDEPPLPTTKMNDDQRMAYILAYAVCLKDLEDAQKKLKIYETRYQNVAPRHELESLKLKIQDEKASTQTLNEETETIENELLVLKDEEALVQNELEEFRKMPEGDRLEAVRAKFARERREGGDEEEEGAGEQNSEDDEEEEGEFEGDEEGNEEGDQTTV